MEETYKDSLRYEGTRWRLIYGTYEGVEKHAVNELQKMVQDYLPYVIEVAQACDGAPPDKTHLILIGTAANNSLIAALVKDKQITVPDRPEGFTIRICDSPWSEETRVGVIAGADSLGVLHGVQDFGARVLAAKAAPDLPSERRKAFDEIPDTLLSDYPLIKNRGIWTWGYVVRDYRRFIDNMARLKMNLLTLWNDCLPLNVVDVIDYAHSRGVRILLGFHWGWGLNHLTLSDPDHRRQIGKMVLDNYNRHYRGLPMDGIYFQTLTEGHDKSAGHETLAACACKLVNGIAAELFEESSDMYVQFGLHAMSIQDDYEDLGGLDPRVTIVWEDAGVLPFCYNPVTEAARSGWSTPKKIDTFEKTLAYAKRLATFRAGSEFAMVAKGFVTLRWDDEFEHHGPFILGRRSGRSLRRRLEQRRDRWDTVNALWSENYPLAMKFYREILDCSPPAMTVSGLIEDAAFEESIQLSTALFAETIWNPHRDEKEILRAALSPYYTI